MTIGTMLYNGIIEMTNSMPQELKELIENNFNFNVFIDETRTERNKLVSRKHELEVINGKELKESNMTLCQLRIDNAINDVKKEQCDITAHTVLLFVLFYHIYMYCTLHVLYILHTVHMWWSCAWIRGIDDRCC